MTSMNVDRSDEVVEKVLRRAELAKMARLLQNRLALASFKTKHGWENLDMNTIEPKIESELKRKRPHSSGDLVSDTSSCFSDLHYHRGMMAPSSPLTDPLFSDDVNGSGGISKHAKQMTGPGGIQRSASSTDSRKRVCPQSIGVLEFPPPRYSWKRDHHLPQSSPGYPGQHLISRGSNAQYNLATSNVSKDPSSSNIVLLSDEEDDDQDLPTHPFPDPSSRIRSSPPRTPPPTKARSARFRDANIATAADGPETGEEGADLLLYLATSPSPANPAMRARVFPPSTPPSQNHGLPSSMMATPNGNGFIHGFGNPTTPSPAFNFADFVNITPSPAQVAWNHRTPATIKTPLAAREARRKINFDALAPPSSSPNLSNLNAGPNTRQGGLGMELGGELIS